MNLKIFIPMGFLIGTVLLTGCGTAGPASDSTKFTASVRDTAPIEVVLGSDPATFDFGTISMREGKVSQTYLLKNGSGEPRTITNIVTSCICTDATIEGRTFGMHGDNTAAITLAQGEKKKIVVRFNPNAHGPEATGPITRDVYITTDHPTYPQTRVRFKGEVVK